MDYDAISKSLSDLIKHKYSYAINRQNLKRQIVSAEKECQKRVGL